MLITILSLALIPTNVFAIYDNAQIVKSGTNYIVYIEDMASKDFKFAIDITDKRGIKQRLRLDPKIVACLALAFGIGDKRSDDFQNILFRMDIRERIKVHGF